MTRSVYFRGGSLDRRVLQVPYDIELYSLDGSTYTLRQRAADGKWFGLLHNDTRAQIERKKSTRLFGDSVGAGFVRSRQ